MYDVICGWPIRRKPSRYDVQADQSTSSDYYETFNLVLSFKGQQIPPPPTPQQGVNGKKWKKRIIRSSISPELAQIEDISDKLFRFFQIYAQEKRKNLKTTIFYHLELDFTTFGPIWKNFQKITQIFQDICSGKNEKSGSGTRIDQILHSF